MSTLIALHYIIYLAVIVLVILRVGHLLHKSGAVYLDQMLSYNLKMAKSVNDMLLLGYYLVNIGWSIFSLTAHMGRLNTPQDLIESLSYKLGIIVFALGVMHFINMLVIYLMHTYHGKKFVHHKTFES